MAGAKFATVRIRVVADDIVPVDASRWLAGVIHRSILERGTASVAFSGGSTPRPMIEMLARARLDWSAVEVFQVDERIAPDGDPARNANLLDPLPIRRGQLHLMEVTSADLAGAAARYAGLLPERFDVVHLGLGDDGHTASWLPGDGAADADADVALTPPYQGHRRMTLTADPVNRARRRLLVVAGASKAAALAGFVRGDGELPAARLRRTYVTIIADRAAAQGLPAPD